ncbi:MAG: AIM24 family protein, partial [Spirochaetaceae bacterium]|nr:AIM24 family protein [Spirochaetaceae bacterium]
MDTVKTDFPYTIDSSPDYAFLNVTIPGGKTLRVEAEAMAAMNTSISMKTKMKGGLKRMFSGEKLFINEYSAGTDDAYI